MTETQKLDIAQRIAEAVSRTSEPRLSGSGSRKEGSKIIGSVPAHLRGLHNLLAELGDEADEVERKLYDARQRFDAVRTVFFEALKEHVAAPEGARGVTILEDWHVAANFPTERDDAGKSFGELLAAALGGQR